MSMSHLGPYEVDRLEKEMSQVVPLGVLFACKGNTPEQIMFMYPYDLPPEVIKKVPRNFPNKPRIVVHKHEDMHHSMRTQYGLATDVLARLLCVHELALDAHFDVKIENKRYVGHPISIADKTSNCPHIIHIAFALPPNVEQHIVDCFQQLSQKLAYAVDSLQTMNGYLQNQCTIMQTHYEDWQAQKRSERKEISPWEKIRQSSPLAQLLAQCCEDVIKTGVVQIFVDNFVEVGFCVESRALAHAHLTPHSRGDIDRIVKLIRPYHGVLLLEDVSPSPDANPSVGLLLKHCDPDRSILDMSTASGIPLMQVLLIVRHLLTWARAMVIYPLCNTNVYTSATTPKPLGKEIVRFNKQFGEGFHLGSALAQFNPPACLSSYVDSNMALADQQMRTRVVCHMIRHQLIMQLHHFGYIIHPGSCTELPPQTECPDEFLKLVDAAPDCPIIPMHSNDDLSILGGLPHEVRPILKNMLGVMLQTKSYEEVDYNFRMFLRIIPFLNGEHHVEDMMYRLNEKRTKITDIIEEFELIICSFNRPDFIASID